MPQCQDKSGGGGAAPCGRSAAKGGVSVCVCARVKRRLWQSTAVDADTRDPSHVISAVIETIEAVLQVLRRWSEQSGGPRSQATLGAPTPPASTPPCTAPPSSATTSTGCMTLVCRRSLEIARIIEPSRMFANGILKVRTTGGRPGTKYGMHTRTTLRTVVEFRGIVASRPW